MKNILLPTDGSEAAVRAAKVVAAFARQSDNPHVTIVTAIQPAVTGNRNVDERVALLHNDDVRRQAGCALEKTAAPFAACGVPYTTRIIDGYPASRAIAAEVDAGEYDLVALGSRGQGMCYDETSYLGTVAGNVIRQVDIPVLVVPVHRMRK